MEKKKIQKCYKCKDKSKDKYPKEAITKKTCENLQL